MVPALSASLAALFLTRKHPFIMSQRDRRDCELKEIEYDVEVSPSDTAMRDAEHPMEADI